MVSMCPIQTLYADGGSLGSSCVLNRDLRYGPGRFLDSRDRRHRLRGDVLHLKVAIRFGECNTNVP